MHAHLLALVLVALLPATSFAQNVLEVVTDRPEAMYDCGEKATFRVRLLRDKKEVTEGEISYVLSVDGFKTLSSGKLTLSDKPAVVSGTLTEPGFLRCQVASGTGKTMVASLAAAA